MNERHTPEREQDDRPAADAARASAPPTRWICPYCGNELRDALQGCCGENHAMPIWKDDDAAF